MHCNEQNRVVPSMEKLSHCKSHRDSPDTMVPQKDPAVEGHTIRVSQSDIGTLFGFLGPPTNLCTVS